MSPSATAGVERSSTSLVSPSGLFLTSACPHLPSANRWTSVTAPGKKTLRRECSTANRHGRGFVPVGAACWESRLLGVAGFQGRALTLAPKPPSCILNSRLRITPGVHALHERLAGNAAFLILASVRSPLRYFRGRGPTGDATPRSPFPSPSLPRAPVFKTMRLP